MTADLAIAFGDSRAVWDQASPFAEVVFPPPTFSAAEREAQARRLTATEWAQPAIGAASAALLALLGQLGVMPRMRGRPAASAKSRRYLLPAHAAWTPCCAWRGAAAS